MSNPDSFIDEVTEEVRRDRLFALFRRYGWIGLVAVLLIVGGSAWTEWQKAQALARSEAFGDGLLAALDADTPEARRAALAEVPASGDQSAIKNLLLASDPEKDRAGSIAALDTLIADESAPQIYRDLAALRRVVVLGAELPPDARRAALEPLTVPGRAFRTLALEQMAFLAIEAGDLEGARAKLDTLSQDQEASAGLRRRTQQMIEALGGARAPD